MMKETGIGVRADKPWIQQVLQSRQRSWQSLASNSGAAHKANIEMISQWYGAQRPDRGGGKGHFVVSIQFQDDLSNSQTSMRLFPPGSGAICST